MTDALSEDATRTQRVAELRAALEAEEVKPHRQSGVKDDAIVHRIADDFRIDEHYEHLLRLRDDRDQRWHDAGPRVQMAAFMYEAQRQTLADRAVIRRPTGEGDHRPGPEVVPSSVELR